MKKLLRPLLFSLLILSGKALAAPCCGAGFTVPSIITSDDKAQLSLSYNHARIHADVFTNGDWRRREESDEIETYKLEGAHIFRDRWQAGLSVPFQTRLREGAMADSSSGLGDISLQLGYEYLPDWDYHPYRPRGIGYLSLITPTGRSIYESKDGSGIDARGRGFWGLGIGTILVKKRGPLDFNMNLEAHYSFPKQIATGPSKGTIIPGYGGSMAIGSGVNWKKLRLGALIDWVYESAVDLEGRTDSRGELKRFANGSLLLSFLYTEEHSFIMSYNDQTLFGSPYNTSLSRSYTLFYQRRWPR